MFAVGVKARILSLAFAAVVVTALCSAVFIVQTRANIQTPRFCDQSALAHTYALVGQENLSGSRAVLEGLARTPVMRAALHAEFIRPELKGIPQDMDVE